MFFEIQNTNLDHLKYRRVCIFAAIKYLSLKWPGLIISNLQYFRCYWIIKPYTTSLKQLLMYYNILG